MFLFKNSQRPSIGDTLYLRLNPKDENSSSRVPIYTDKNNNRYYPLPSRHIGSNTDYYVGKITSTRNHSVQILKHFQQSNLTSCYYNE